jgi:hypothetical protein
MSRGKEVAMAKSITVQAAETIRLELPSLIPADAVAVDRALQALLEQAKHGTDVDGLIDDLLTQHAGTRARWDELLEELGGEKGPGFEELPGQLPAIATDGWACPRGDYFYPIFDADEPPAQEKCPVHHIPLEFRAAG